VIYTDFSVKFRELVRMTGVGSGSPAPPRIHDLRHSFAVKTLIGWYREGLDVGALLPRLSTYLGHLTPGHTYWYLSAAPELLELAGARLEKRSRR
jgi:integrase